MTVRGRVGDPDRARTGAAAADVARCRTATRPCGSPATASSIEDLYGTELDIEWCRADGAGLICCRRGPITGRRRRQPRIRGTTAGPATSCGPTPTSARRIPDVMTPATWSIVQVFMSDAMADGLAPAYGVRQHRRPDLHERQCDGGPERRGAGIQTAVPTWHRGGVRPAARRASRSRRSEVSLAEDAGLGGAGGRPRPRRGQAGLPESAGVPRRARRSCAPNAAAPDRRHPVRPRAGPAVADADRTRVPPGLHDAGGRRPAAAVPRS